MFPLEIFPYASLSSSVITTVWIGVVVIALFNLRLGWVLSGLVVPGYLVPLIIVKPMSAGLIVVESIVTYFVVVFFSESLSSLSRWSSIFGRDRFYALIVSSVLVRLLFDVILVPLAGEWINLTTGYEFDYRNELQSFGLIIVALMANQYWKTGISRGLFVLVVTVAITWFIVRYGLMEFTNFSIGNLRFMYEDLAASLLSSPKAYIILLTTAFICSRLNLLYGWDFNGILLPSLLALQWFQPIKILTSFIEALVILLVSRQLLKLPMLARMNMEGARLLLLFFNVSFAYKMFLGFALPLVWPDLKITDTYGFGYLLATLLALKMHQKDIIGRVSRMTLQASLVSIICASFIGFGLTLVSKQSDYFSIAQQQSTAPDLKLSDEPLDRFLDEQKIQLIGARALSQVAKPLSVELDAFMSALRHVRDYIDQPSDVTLSVAARLFVTMGYQLTEVEGRYLVIHEEAQQRGWGVYVIDSQAPTGLNLQVPHAVDDRFLVDSGVAIFGQLQARSIALSASPRLANNDGSSDMRVEPGTVFHAFHTTFARDSVIQVLALDKSPAVSGDEPVTSRVLISDRIPETLDFTVLKHVVGSFGAHWNHRIDDNIHKKTATGGFVEVALSDSAQRRIVGLRRDKPLNEIRLTADDTYRDRLLQEQDAYQSLMPAPVVALSMAQTIYLDDFVITPLLRAVDTFSQAHQDAIVFKEDLRLIDQSAGALGYQVTLLTSQSEDEFILLQDINHRERRWGLALIRVSPQRDYLVHAMQSTVEYGTLNVAMDLFTGVKAAVMTLSPGASRRIAGNDNHQSAPLATLVGQIVMREAGDAPMLALVPRAYAVTGKTQLPQTDVVIGVASGEFREQQLRTQSMNNVVTVLQQQGLSVGFVDGSLATTTYQPSWLTQSAYLDATRNKDLVALWLSPNSRSDYKPASSLSSVQRSFKALGLSTQETALATYLQESAASDASTVAADVQLVEAIRRYQTNRDIVGLSAMVTRWPDVVFKHIKDTRSQDDYLVVASQRAQPLAVARLTQNDSALPIAFADLRTDAAITTLSHPDTTLIISGED